jgi:hypothetical protein
MHTTLGIQQRVIALDTPFGGVFEQCDAKQILTDPGMATDGGLIATQHIRRPRSGSQPEQVIKRRKAFNRNHTQPITPPVN